MKTLYLLNIGDYSPKLTALTYPSIYAWADKIDARVHVISERKFAQWPVTYEKLQIHDLAKENGDDWAIYVDSDTLIHPELPDVTELLPRDTIAHNAVDFAPLRWSTYDDYFRRDGRHIGSANWFAVASSWCLDLWRPLEVTPEKAIANISVTVPESKLMKSEHLVDDYALSSNIARFGLKVTTLTDIWARYGLTQADFFYHQYLIDTEEKIAQIKATMERWA